jgi:4'-phosphopantetheinyl transferase
MSQTLNISDSGFQIETPLALPEDEVHLWRVDLEALQGDEPRWRKLLSPDELTRSDRFHFPRDRQHFVASRALVRTILASYLAQNPSSLNFSYSQKEKPSLGPADAGGNIKFNVSHSGGTALIAVTRARDIGVDVEQLRHDFDLEAIARRFFSTQEQNQIASLPTDERVEAFFRCWTRKEAYIKATGDGLSLPLSQFDVSVGAEEKNALLATRPDGSEAGRWLLQEVPGGSGFAAALCVRGRGWKLKAWSTDRSG